MEAFSSLFFTRRVVLVAPKSSLFVFLINQIKTNPSIKALLLFLFDSISVSKLSDMAEKTSKLKQLNDTLDRIKPIFDDINQYEQIVDPSGPKPNTFIDEFRDANKLVYKSLKIKTNLLKKFLHSRKLKELNQKLLRFFQPEDQAEQSRDVTQTLVEVTCVSERMTSLELNVENLEQTPSNSSRSLSWRYIVTCEREKMGWAVPPLPRGIIAFEDPVEKLKAKLLDDDDDDDDVFLSRDYDGGFGNVVVVSGGGGCGKTILAHTMCYHPEIQDRFGENIFYVKVSQRPNFMAIVSDLFNPNPFCQEVDFRSNDEARSKMVKFLLEQVSGPILLVLDDVWSDSFIKNFQLNIRGYKIFVTSRMIFPKYDVFRLKPLSHQYAKTLFQKSGFTGRNGSIIDDDLVNQMVKCCKNHPLTLSVMGSCLNGKYESVWKAVIRMLSQGEWVLDDKDVLKRLERTIEELEEEFKKCILDFEALDEDLKQYLLDFGLFPGDQRLPASVLLDLWVNLYDHDELGKDTLTKIFQLSYKKLVNAITIGQEANASVNYCEQTFVTQQDLFREAAVHLSSRESIAKRTRLIIDAQGEDLPQSIRLVQEPMQACILSISTGELFSSNWCNMRVPEVEIMVLNIMSKTYTLPHFLEYMQKLKILIVTNYGVYPTRIKNFHRLGCLSNLSRIRLEHVAVSSLSTSILALENLQKVSLIMCEIGDAFEELSSDNLRVWPQLAELEMDNCQDLVEFPGLLCSSVHLKILSIINCNELREISEEFGNLTSLETLCLRSCTKLEKLPESITRLERLSVLDISDCLSLSELPEQMGNLVGLRKIYMKGCKGIHELPSSVEKLSHTHVVCNEEISYQWREFENVKIPVVEEDRLLTLMENIPYLQL